MVKYKEPNLFTGTRANWSVTLEFDKESVF